MNLEIPPAKVIQTLTDYPQVYRFRLWVALVEDMELLGMGHRAYHSHIFESFRSWAAQGIEFQNAKGRDLVIDALRKDDVYGFLGKRDERPGGPKRNIETSKFAVLDAFFRQKYPDLAASFAVQTPTTQLVSVLKSFFAKEPQQTLSNEELHRLFRSIDGIYIPFPQISVSKIRRAMESGEDFDFTVPVFLVTARLQLTHCIVHKVEFPLESRFLRFGSEASLATKKMVSWIERHRPEQTMIFSGLGVPTDSAVEIGDPAFSCVLRDRTLYRPCLTTLSINQIRYESYPDDGDASWQVAGLHETSGNSYRRYFQFCRDANHYADLKGNLCYSADFINEIFELKEKLGAEI